MILSIGVTTYNRLEYLKMCISSILKNNSLNFEILIGNDFVSQLIKPEDLGIKDSRVRIINYEKNLGEVNNLNYLLGLARGKYFIWLADDDEFYPGLIDEFEKIILNNPKLKFVVPKCISAERFEVDTDKKYKPSVKTLSSKTFIFDYIEGNVTLQGVYIFYDTNLLREIGGIKKLGTGFGPYSDSILVFELIKRFSTVTYMDFPWVLFRVHDASISNTSGSLDAYASAQRHFFDIYKNLNIANLNQLDIFERVVKVWFFPHCVDVFLRENREDLLKFLNYVNFVSKIILYLGFKRGLRISFAFLLSCISLIKCKISYALKQNN